MMDDLISRITSGMLRIVELLKEEKAKRDELKLRVDELEKKIDELQGKKQPTPIPLPEEEA